MLSQLFMLNISRWNDILDVSICCIVKMVEEVKGKRLLWYTYLKALAEDLAGGCKGETETLHILKNYIRQISDEIALLGSKANND